MAQAAEVDVTLEDVLRVLLRGKPPGLVLADLRAAVTPWLGLAPFADVALPRRAAPYTVRLLLARGVDEWLDRPAGPAGPPRLTAVQREFARRRLRGGAGLAPDGKRLPDDEPSWSDRTARSRMEELAALLAAHLTSTAPASVSAQRPGPVRQTGAPTWLHPAYDALVRRQDGLERLAGWWRTPSPSLLVRADPGGGKSSLLIAFLRELAADALAPNVVAVLREPTAPDPYHLNALLRDVARALLPPDAAADGAGLADRAGQLALAQPDGLLSLIEDLSATPGRPVLVAVDAVDQLDDAGRSDFLAALGRLLEMASGTRLRVLLTSRTTLPLQLPDTDDELLLERDDAGLAVAVAQLLDGLSPSDRQRAQQAVLDGAQGNWLWACTNAAVLARDHAGGALPAVLQLTAGLDGLYRDARRGLEVRTGEGAERHLLERLLALLAVVEDGWLGRIELAWALDCAPSTVQRLAERASPFVRSSGDGRHQLFHPDFARWVLHVWGTDDAEADAHLRLADGLTRFGDACGWTAATADHAAPTVLSHWASGALLQPFHPRRHEHVAAVEALLRDARWVAQAGAVLSSVRAVGRALPLLRLPGSDVPLHRAVNALVTAPQVHGLIGMTLVDVLDGASLDEWERLFDSGDVEGATRLLGQLLPDYEAVAARTLWTAVISGLVRMEEDAGRLTVVFDIDVLAAWLHTQHDPQDQRIGLGAAQLLLLEDPAAVAPAVRQLVADAGAVLWSKPGLVAALGNVGDLPAAQVRARLQLLHELVERAAALPAPDSGDLLRRLDFARANALWALDDQSEQELVELVEVQGRIARWREHDGGSSPRDLARSRRLLRVAHGRLLVAGDADGRDEELRRLAASARDELALLEPGDLSRRDLLMELSLLLNALSEPAADDLVDLVRHRYDLVALASSSEERAERLRRLVLALLRQVALGGDGSQQHLAEALVWARQAVTATDPEREDRRSRVQLLVAVLERALAVTSPQRAEAVLEELVELRRELATRWPTDDASDLEALDAAVRRLEEHRATHGLAALRAALQERDRTGDDAVSQVVALADALLGHARTLEEDLELVELQRRLTEAWPLDARADPRVARSHELLAQVAISAARRLPEGERRAELLSTALAAARRVHRSSALPVEERQRGLVDEANATVLLHVAERDWPAVLAAQRALRDEPDLTPAQAVRAQDVLARMHGLWWGSRADDDGTPAEVVERWQQEAQAAVELAGRATRPSSAWADLVEEAERAQQAAALTPTGVERHVQLVQAMLQHFPPHDPRAAPLRAAAASGLAWLANRSDQPNSLWQAAAAGARSVLSANADPQVRWRALAVLADELWARAELSLQEQRELADLQEEICAGRRSLGTTSWRQAGLLLVRALDRLWVATTLDKEKQQAVSRAIPVARALLAEVELDGDDRLEQVWQLTTWLWRRDERSAEELDELFALLDELTADGDVHPMVLVRRAGALADRARRATDAAERAGQLRAAIDLWLQALPELDHPRALQAAVLVANARLELVLAGEAGMTALTAAVTLLREVLTTLPRDVSRRPLLDLLPVVVMRLKREGLWPHRATDDATAG